MIEFQHRRFRSQRRLACTALDRQLRSLDDAPLQQWCQPRRVALHQHFAQGLEPFGHIPRRRGLFLRREKIEGQRARAGGQRSAELVEAEPG